MSMAPDERAQQPAASFRPQIRIGTATARRGGAEVRFTQSEPAGETGGQWQPLTRVVDDSELADAGLFEGRVFDISERGEEALVSKDLHVREELRVTRSTTARVEQVEDRLRRTEVEVEEIAPADRQRALGEIGGPAGAQGGQD